MSSLASSATLPQFETSTGWLWWGDLGTRQNKVLGGKSFPSISVITPSYNQAKFLEETIRSVVSQGYPNLEYIVMDGGSIDGSVEIIKKYEPWLSAWKSAPDHGQYDAVQKGFQGSRGEIMAYLNSDDLYFPWTLRVVAELFAQYPALEWLTASQIAVAAEDSRFSFVGQIHNRSRRWFFRNRGKRLGQIGFIPQEATFWRRSLWEKSGARLDTTLRYAGDLELWARFFEHTAPVMVDMPLAVFRMHKGQKTAQPIRYIAEANQVISRYPTPVWVPAIFLGFLNFIYRHSASTGNWLGAQADKLIFNPGEGRWHYIKALAWRSR